MRDKIFWQGAVAFFVIGDSVTTAIGLNQDGIIEIGPAAAPLIAAYGLPIMILMKAVLVLTAFAIWRHAGRSSDGLWRYITTTNRIGIPLGMALLGAGVTAWNSYVILSVSV